MCVCVCVCVRAWLLHPACCTDKRLVSTDVYLLLWFWPRKSLTRDQERRRVMLIDQLASRIPFSTFNKRRPLARSAPGGGRDSLAPSGTREQGGSISDQTPDTVPDASVCWCCWRRFIPRGKPVWVIRRDASCQR